MTEKNLELLRPFDLEAAKRGDGITDLCGCEVVYIDGPDAAGNYVVRIDGHFAVVSSEQLRMAPLAWVEGRPVYQGDVLYAQNVGRGIAVGVDGEHLRLVTEDGMPWGLFIADHVTWTPPKVKREGWGVLRVERVSRTREEAESILKQYDGSNILSDTFEGKPRVVRIEWEEPAA